MPGFQEQPSASKPFMDHPHLRENVQTPSMTHRALHCPRNLTSSPLSHSHTSNQTVSPPFPKHSTPGPPEVRRCGPEGGRPAAPRPALSPTLAPTECLSLSLTDRDAEGHQAQPEAVPPAHDRAQRWGLLSAAAPCSGWLPAAVPASAQGLPGPGVLSPERRPQTRTTASAWSRRPGQLCPEGGFTVCSSLIHL